MNKSIVKALLCMLCCVSFIACNKETKEDLYSRAAELCRYIPDHELLERSKDYMTEDFYSLLEIMFNLPEHEAMDHEWLYYFVTGNGGTIADYEVVEVEKIDDTHAIAYINVRQMWEDSTYTDEDIIEEHRLCMEKVDGKWLMSDFDEHKQDCIDNIANWLKEEALRQAISAYLVKEIGSQYSQGDICIPTLMIVATEEIDATHERVWGNHWVFNYKIVGDTLKTVSGGNHSGCMTIAKEGNSIQAWSIRDVVPEPEKLHVTEFEQTEDGAAYEASAKRIFGEHYDVYQNMHSSEAVREAVRQEQLQQYIQRHCLNIKYYQDFGRDAVEL